MIKVDLDVVCRCFCESTCSGIYDTCTSLGTCRELDDFKHLILNYDK